jgi:hypothetical protein
LLTCRLGFFSKRFFEKVRVVAVAGLLLLLLAEIVTGGYGVLTVVVNDRVGERVGGGSGGVAAGAAAVSEGCKGVGMVVLTVVVVVGVV